MTYDIVGEKHVERHEDWLAVRYCNCDRSHVYPVGAGAPMFLTDRRQAIAAFAALFQSDALYWAVHLNGKHLIDVKIYEEWIAEEDLKSRGLKSGP